MIEGPRLDDIRATISTYGAPIQWLWGKFRVAGNIIWAAPVLEDITEEEENDVIVRKFYYFATFAVGLCRGPIAGVLKIWLDGKLVFNIEEGSETAVAMEGLSFRVYLGDEAQEPDPTMEEVEGDGNVPPYRGLAYILFQNLPLLAFGNHVPSVNVEAYTVETVPNPVKAVEGTAQGSGGLVVNPRFPSYVIYESLGHWYKINMLTATIASHRDYTDPAWVIPSGLLSEPHGPFDIDERGMIYTSRAGGTDSVFVTISADNFALFMQGTATDIGSPTQFTVVRNRLAPYLYAIEAPGPSQSDNELFLVDRETLEWPTDDPDEHSVKRFATPVGGIAWRSTTANNENGVAYAAASYSPSPSTRPCYIRRFEASNPLIYQDFEVSASVKGDITAMAVDPGTNQLIVFVNADYTEPGNPNAIAFFDADSMALIAKMTMVGVGGAVWSDFKRGVVNGSLWLSKLASIIQIDVANHEIIFTYALVPGNIVGSFQGSGVYDPITHSYFQVTLAYVAGAHVYKIPFRGNAETVPLWQIVDDICSDAGLVPSADLDTAELIDDVMGFLINGRMPARAAIEPLMNAYFFDGVESGATLKFPKRGGTSVLTVPETDLAAHRADEQRPQELITRRQEDLELPVLVEVEYADAPSDYQVAIQSERRLITQSDERVAVRLPLVLGADEAKQIAVKQLATAWIGRTSHQFALPRKYAYLDATDVITVEEGGGTHVVRLEQAKLQGGVVSCQAVNEDSSAYVSDAPGVGIPPAPGTVAYEGPTSFIVIDTMLTEYGHNRPGVLVVTTGITAYWRGAILFRSEDNLSWQHWTVSLADATIGHAQSVLADTPDPFVWDDGGTVNVWLDDGADTLSNATKAEVLNGANLAFLGDELIQFKTASENADGSWALSGLLRGRYGTDWATGTHVAGEAFAMLDGDESFAQWPLEDLNVERFVKAASIGQSIQSGRAEAFTCRFRNLQPLSVQHVDGTRDGSNNLTITWIRRGRFLGDWRDEVDVPIGETSESYSIDVMSGSTVVRTLTSSSESVTYTASQQSADGLVPGDPVTCRVYQLSAEVGRGIVTEVTI